MKETVETIQSIATPVKTMPRANLTGRGHIAFTEKNEHDYLAQLQRGIEQDVALDNVGIAYNTLVVHRKRSTEFARQERIAKSFTLKSARLNIHADIVDKKNVNTSKWYLDREVYDKEKQASNTVNFFTQVNNLVTEDRSKFVDGEVVDAPQD